VRTLLATALALLTGCEGAMERSLIYYPTRGLEATPADLGLVFEEVRVTAEDGVRLFGWYVPGPRRAVTLLWCHGNAGNISHRLENLRLLRDRLGIGVLLFDYRGYGLSEGTPSEAGTHSTRAVRGWLAPGAGSAGCHFGRSSAPPSPPGWPSTTRRPRSSWKPFTSVARWPTRRCPASATSSARYDTLGLVDRVRSPLLVLHGDADEVVPFRHGRAIFEAAREPKRFVRIPGARHNDTYLVGGAPYWQAWQDFFAAYVPGW
jgi:fermentation-respiration switch protein FrsA (DUF1100 family)